MPSDSLRLRLQLAVGSFATLGDELPAMHGRRAFAATSRLDGSALLVTLHLRPSDGPDPALLASRIDHLRELAHPVLVLPVSLGELEGRAWVIESSTPGATAAEEVSDRRLPSITQGILILRDLARALAAMHRRGLSHGALDLETVRITPSGALLTGLGRSLGTTPQEDLDALGRTLWTLLTGTAPDGARERLSARRRGVPAEFDALLASLTAADPARRPQRAEAILEVLDAFPASRPRRPRAAYIVLILLATAILLYALIVRRT